MRIEVQGKTIELTEKPYTDELDDDPYVKQFLNAGWMPEVLYKAHGKDEDGNEYIVIWDKTDDSDLHNWDKPSGIMSV